MGYARRNRLRRLARIALLACGTAAAACGQDLEVTTLAGGNAPFAVVAPSPQRHAEERPRPGIAAIDVSLC
jgi:hypothetical protein